MRKKDYDRTVVTLFGRDIQASSLIAAGMWWVGALVALAVGLAAWTPGLALAGVLAIIGLVVAAAG